MGCWVHRGPEFQPDANPWGESKAEEEKNMRLFGRFFNSVFFTLGSILFAHKSIVNCVGVPFAFEAFGRFFVNLPINVSDGGCTFKLHVAVFGRKMLPLSLEAESKDFSKSQLECGRTFDISYFSRFVLT